MMIPLHEETRSYIYPIRKDTLDVRLRLFDAGPCTVRLIWFKRAHPTKTYALDLKTLDASKKIQSVWYHGTLVLKETARYLKYVFEIKEQDNTLYYSPEGLTEAFPQTCFQYLYTNQNDIIETPSWAQGAIGYHIFVDRFNRLDDRQDLIPWQSRPTRTNVFGGTLKGITEKLGYLKSLSVNMIILTPIFKATSNHKYDTTDYHAIDPTFGTTEDLNHLVSSAHALDIKIILDGVFNHVGYHHPWFQDVIRHGNKSMVADWFDLHGDKVNQQKRNYACVGDYKWMPKLNHSNPDVRKYLLDVGSSWINKSDIDGWRLDVADEIDLPFWHAFKNHVAAHKKDLYLVGESWKNGHDLLQGDVFDAVMNYRLRDLLINFFITNTIDANTFKSHVEDILFSMPRPMWHLSYNLLGSHDTKRIRTIAKDNPHGLKLAIGCLVAMIGIPVIFYGDELGLTGQNDPDCRKPMPWETSRNNWFSFYQDTLSKREIHPSLKHGSFVHAALSDQVYLIERTSDDDHVLCLFNLSKETYTLHLDEIIGITQIERAQEIHIHINAGTFQIIRIPEGMVSETGRP